VSSVGSFFSYINDARSHEPEVGQSLIRDKYCHKINSNDSACNVSKTLRSAPQMWTLNLDPMGQNVL